MKKQRLFLFLFSLILVSKSFSQGVILTQPRLESNGNQLIIGYDIITKNNADQFYIWVEIKKSNGEIIKANSLSGDIGANVKAGSNKKIIWSPEQDSIFLNEDILVEVKAEKYNKTFNKGSIMLKSIIFPGWGQTTVGKGRPWWLTGVAVYGALTGGYIYHSKYLNSLKSYKAEEDPLKREAYLQQTQKELNMSTALIYSAASVWAVNVLWVALTPNKNQPLQHAKISLNSSPTLYNRELLLSLKLDF